MSDAEFVPQIRVHSVIYKAENVLTPEVSLTTICISLLGQGYQDAPKKSTSLSNLTLLLSYV